MVENEYPSLADKLTIAVSSDVSIRLMQSSDSLEFFQLIERARSDLRKWLSWVDEVTCIEDVARRNEQCLKAKHEGKSLRFFIVYRESIIGMVSAKRIDWEAKLAELSYSIDPFYRRRGITTEACKVLIDYLNDVLGIDSYEIRTAIGNHPSERVAEKLGFEFIRICERSEKLNGDWVDHKVYANKPVELASEAPSRS